MGGVGGVGGTSGEEEWIRERSGGPTWAGLVGPMASWAAVQQGGGASPPFVFFVSLLYFLSFIYFVVSFIFSFIKLPLVPNLYLPINYYEINS